jgi:hypothetical protein
VIYFWLGKSTLQNKTLKAIQKLLGFFIETHAEIRQDHQTAINKLQFDDFDWIKKLSIIVNGLQIFGFADVVVAQCFGVVVSGTLKR